MDWVTKRIAEMANLDRLLSYSYGSGQPVSLVSNGAIVSERRYTCCSCHPDIGRCEPCKRRMRSVGCRQVESEPRHKQIGRW